MFTVSNGVIAEQESLNNTVLDTIYFIKIVSKIVANCYVINAYLYLILK